MLHTGIGCRITHIHTVGDLMMNAPSSSEKNYRIFFEQAPDAVVLIEPATGLILQANRFASRLLGFTEDELCRMHAGDFDVVESEEQLLCYPRAVASDTRGAYTTRKRCKAGNVIDVEVSTVSIPIERKIFILEIWRGITERKRAVELLHRNEMRLKEALALANVGSWELDIVNNVITWSEEVYKIFEIDPVQFGASYEAFLNACHPEDRAEVDSAYTNSLKTHTPYVIDHRIQFPDNRIKYVHERCKSFYNDKGEAVRSIGTVLDITERKRTEDELTRYKDHLEELVEARTVELACSNEELERFAYICSHDLQEPLRMVTSYLQLLEKRYKHKLDNDADDFINFAVGGAKRMKTLINDLLIYSRVGTKGKEFQPVDCEKVVDDVLDNLEVAIHESGAKILRESLPTVIGDGTQLVQLFQNLIGNALKFRSDRSPVIRISARKQNGFWKFLIQDNGIGIKREYFAQIFQVFHRLHNREEYPGTGIGLAVCKRIAQRHGGTIDVKSTPGAGSVFSFTISNRGDDDEYFGGRKSY